MEFLFCYAMDQKIVSVRRCIMLGHEEGFVDID